jgi:hypothetical protein
VPVAGAPGDAFVLIAASLLFCRNNRLAPGRRRCAVWLPDLSKSSTGRLMLEALFSSNNIYPLGAIIEEVEMRI